MLNCATSSSSFVIPLFSCLVFWVQLLIEKFDLKLPVRSSNRSFASLSGWIDLDAMTYENILKETQHDKLAGSAYKKNSVEE